MKQAIEKAIKLLQTGQLDLAEREFNEVLTTSPNHTIANHLLGITLYQKGDYTQAEKFMRTSIQTDPDRANVHFDLANLLRHTGRYEEAIEEYKEAAKYNPNSTILHHSMGLVYQDLDLPEHAIKSYTSVIKIDPNNASAWHNIGNVQKQLGLIDDAIFSYQQAIKIQPDYAKAYRALTHTKKYTELDNDARSMRKQLKSKTITDEQRIDLNFGLGKVYEDIKKYNKAFDCLLKGNLIQRQSSNYNTQDTRTFFEKKKQVFTKIFLDKNADTGYFDSTPIFIIGMPRSGTSLVEQILASHPDVHGAGELTDLYASFSETCSQFKSATLLDCVSKLDKKSFSSMGVDYINRIRRYSANSKHITDKMPSNFHHIGLIKTILPNAKIIHCHRDPMDNCWSLFKNKFTNGHEFTNNLEELGEYYKLYQNLIKHWEEVLPDCMYNIKYEDLVTNQEQETRALLEHCELSWDDNCLAFHQSNRLIKTASSVQVRQKMYNDSVKLWENYGDKLAPLKRVFKRIEYLGSE